MDAEDESNITDIELLPDGRICVFGTSLEVLDVLDAIQSGRDGTIRGRLQASECAAPPAPANLAGPGDRS